MQKPPFSILADYGFLSPHLQNFCYFGTSKIIQCDRKLHAQKQLANYTKPTNHEQTMASLIQRLLISQKMFKTIQNLISKYYYRSLEIIVQFLSLKEPNE